MNWLMSLDHMLLIYVVAALGLIIVILTMLFVKLRSNGKQPRGSLAN